MSHSSSRLVAKGFIVSQKYLAVYGLWISCVWIIRCQIWASRVHFCLCVASWAVSLKRTLTAGFWNLKPEQYEININRNAQVQALFYQLQTLGGFSLVMDFTVRNSFVPSENEINFCQKKNPCYPWSISSAYPWGCCHTFLCINRVTSIKKKMVTAKLLEIMCPTTQLSFYRNIYYQYYTHNYVEQSLVYFVTECYWGLLTQSVSLFFTVVSTKGVVFLKQRPNSCTKWHETYP